MAIEEIAIISLLSLTFSINFSQNIKEFFQSLLTLGVVNLALVLTGFSIKTVAFINTLLAVSSFLLPHDRLLRFYKMKKITDLLRKIQKHE